MSQPVQVSDEQFESEVIQSGVPVLVDFWAPWCAPCKQIAPILDEISAEYAEKIKVAKVDVEQYKENAAKYGIRGIPTMLLFKDGEVAATQVGLVSKSELANFIDTNI